MAHNVFTHTVTRGRALFSHVLTGTLWAVGRPAFLEGLCIIGAALFFERFVPLPLGGKIVGLLVILAVGSYVTTRRHRADHLQHSATVTALVLLAALGILLWRGYTLGAISGTLAGAFFALFFGYRRAFS